MKGKLFAALLALGVSGQAAAQDPAANLQNALGNLVPNLTATADALLAMSATDTAVALNNTIGDLHMDLSAGTPLETNNNLGDGLLVLIRPHTMLLDSILSGEESLDNVLSQTDLEALTTLGSTVLFTVGPGLLSRPEGTILDPTTFLVVFEGLLPFNNLTLTSLLGGGTGGGLPVGLLDPAALTGLLGGAGGGAGGLPLGSLPLSAVLDLLAAGNAGGGLALGELPLPLDALDPSTLTALLGGAQLPGL